MVLSSSPGFHAPLNTIHRIIYVELYMLIWVKEGFFLQTQTHLKNMDKYSEFALTPGFQRVWGLEYPTLEGPPRISFTHILIAPCLPHSREDSESTVHMHRDHYNLEEEGTPCKCWGNRNLPGNDVECWLMLVKWLTTSFRPQLVQLL